MRSVVDAGLLPDGVLQLLVGGVEGLLDALDGQDLLSVTGSAGTARRLRAHPAVVERGVRFTAEADSLNGAVLGPDAVPGTEELDLFVREVVREMTAKAGQKCTAVRRALVPRALLDAVTQALRDALEQVVVGDPRDPATRHGRARQPGPARRGAGAGGPARRAGRGRRRRPAVPSWPDSSGVRSCRRCCCASPIRPPPAVHEVEAFGPVASLLPYDAADHAVELLARGRGSLVASVVSADVDFVRQVVLGAARLARAPARARPHLRRRVDGARLAAPARWCTGAPGARAAARSSVGCAGSTTTCSARRAGLAGRPHGAHRRLDPGVDAARRPRCTRSAAPVRAAARRHLREPVPRGDGARTSRTSRSSPATASTPTPTRWPRRPTRCSAGSWRTATWCCPSPRGCSSTRRRGRCSPTPVWSGCASPGRSSPATACAPCSPAPSKTPRTREQGEVRWDVQVLDQDDVVVAAYELLTMVSA